MESGAGLHGRVDRVVVAPRRMRRGWNGVTAGHPSLTVEQILTWADAYHDAHGRWPGDRSGAVAEAPWLTWQAVRVALVHGFRGLPGGSSLTRLLTEHRGVQPLRARREPGAEALRAWEREQFPIRGPRLRLPRRGRRPLLTVDRILDWADAHHAATGRWPNARSGRVLGSPFDDSWAAIHSALQRGLRGLPKGWSLPQLLAERRGVRNKHALPPLDVDQVLAWADAHRAATGQWPTFETGPVQGAPLQETWGAIHWALLTGGRGFQGGSTLAQLLAEHRGAVPVLTVDQILAWADAHREATGRWPSKESGPVVGTHRESWRVIDECLRDGGRGLPDGSSLALLLAERRGVRNMHGRERLSVDRVLAWADAHHEATGRWPTLHSGPVVGAPGENWGTINLALRVGGRGLPRGTTLARLLVEHRGRQAKILRPDLTFDQILAWADAHRATTGRWPTSRSGQVAGAPGETWSRIGGSLYDGNRGLPGGSSLARLLAEHRGARNPLGLPLMTVDRVLAWADAHHEATGRWPSRESGPVRDAPDERWGAICQALSKGHRGLPGGMTLARLLADRRKAGCDPS